MITHIFKANPTVALFYENEIESNSIVHSLHSYPEGIYLFCNESPFHPEDYPNGDQPGDVGSIQIDGNKFNVVDSHTFVSDSLTGEIVRPESKSLLRRGVKEGRYFLHTGHFIIDDETQNFEELSNTALGKKCFLSVDNSYRHTLSKLHTASHIMSLALNQLFETFWAKDVENKDDLGNPDFDFYALQSSKLLNDKVIDMYRIGKSLKKSGFKLEVFNSVNFDNFSKELTTVANKIIADNPNSEIKMVGDSIVLGSMRLWSINIYNKSVFMPCGGTHVERLSELNKVEIFCSYKKEDGLLTIQTIVG